MGERELKPCPFCGPGNSIPGLWFDDASNAYRVNCGRCGSGTGFKPRWTEADAAEAWNTRALASRPAVAEGWVHREKIIECIRDAADRGFEAGSRGEARFRFNDIIARADALLSAAPKP